jgi:glycerol-3-phosphate acyltransferase PlsX
MLTDIAVDAMGSDKAPGPEIAGAILACQKLPVQVHLVGPEPELRPLLACALASQGMREDDLPITIVHASERIGMDEKVATAVRHKDSSMRVGMRLVREHKAAAFLTAGNTGAAMATAKMVLGALNGVDRPALAMVLPTLIEGQPCVLLDVGANVDCKPQNLEQFAVMGELYARSIFRIKRPRVGLLSIGEEEGKGNELTGEAFPLLKRLPLNFVGNVEGRDIYNGEADVIVCDGFVGNVALKTSEGLTKLVRELLKASLKKTVTAQVGALLSRKAFTP